MTAFSLVPGQRAQGSSLNPRLPGRLAVGALVVAVLLAVSATASATTVLRLDLPTLSTASADVLIGHVENSRSHWVEGRIVTDVDIRATVSLKDRVREGETVTVRRLGGRVDDLAQYVAGEADFTVGEQIMVFVDGPTAERVMPLVMGMAQGKFQLVVGPDDRMWAVRDTSQLSLAEIVVRADGTKEVVMLDESELEHVAALPLTDLVRAVASNMRSAGQLVSSSILERLGPDLLRPHDFRRDLVGPMVAPLIDLDQR